ncbi:hypothetical protein LNTAR_12326 [Lentisphaera araneosa HTCC2155]|uniref:Uncharacterized protein n=1 Tax=Lentisphaera araneosa HTCC2155 TaxID=313628 RepID=A6DJR6_9BACT|nr:DUF6880 family protein [Lentisphaera araneosa]EDM28140.1 hypothetical protein LNTAR_12326 [Lentisphaera araneosa HTCC2155]
MNKKKQLVKLGAEKLADLLLDVMDHSDYANDLISRTIATPKRNLLRFQQKLNDLLDGLCFIYWKQSFDFADELRLILQDLKATQISPEQGLEEIAHFYRSDASVMNNADDSSGCIGDVYNSDAQEMFLAYTQACTNKRRVAEYILDLSTNDEYGLRDTVIECANSLPVEQQQWMVKELEDMAVIKQDDYKKRRYLYLVMTLAKQIGDADLYSRTYEAAHGEIGSAAKIDLAKIYFEKNDLDEALKTLETIPNDDFFVQHDKQNLLIEIYQAQGEPGKVEMILRSQFRACRTVHSLESLLNCNPELDKEVILKEESELMLESESFYEHEALFLIHCELIDKAEAYVLRHHDKLNGNAYGALLELVESFEKAEKYLVSSLVYRSLLMSILDRGYTKAYRHGAKYLKKIVKFETEISDWSPYEHHEEFYKKMSETHKRKRSFWAQYND